jgi:uncharacterized protein YjiK
MSKSPKGTLRLVHERPLGVQEASGVVALAGGTFLVVDDEAGIFRCAPDDDPVQLDVGMGLSDLEGICVSADGSVAYVLAERDGSVWRFELDPELGDGDRLGKLPKLGKKKNQGWEGIAFAKAGTFSDDDELVGVHQVSPRRVGFFDAETLRPRLTLRMPKRARKQLGDLNDVAIHPGTSHLFVLSGKEGCIGELSVSDDALELVQLYPVDTAKDDVPEGLTFDSDGRLWLVTDGEGMLRELKLHG